MAGESRVGKAPGRALAEAGVETVTTEAGSLWDVVEGMVYVANIFKFTTHRFKIKKVEHWNSVHPSQLFESFCGHLSGI